MLRLPLAAALCVLPTFAPAAVTPEEVWQEWQSLAVTAAQETDHDGALVLDGVSAGLPQGGRMMIGRVTLAPEGDAVRVTASDAARLLTGGGAEGELAAPGAEITVTGDPGAMRYRLTAPDLATSWSDLQREGSLADLRVGLNNAEVVIDPAAAGISARIDADHARLDTTGSEGATRFTLEQSWTDPAIAFDGSLSVLLGLARPDPDTATTLRLNAAGSTAEAVSDGPDGRATIGTDSLGTTVEATLGDGRLAARQTARDIGVRVTPAGLPPGAFSAGIDALSIALDGPAAPGDAPEAASLDLAIEGLSLSDEAWQLVDPAGRLSRAPATLMARISGSGRLTRDPLARPGALPPVALDRLDIDELRLDALGARAEIDGQLDWDDATGYSLLSPEGRIAVALDGAEGLVDDLLAAGLLTEGQALFAGIALTQFTHATGEGGRAGEIAFDPNGAITIDGTALR